MKTGNIARPSVPKPPQGFRIRAVTFNNTYQLIYSSHICHSRINTFYPCTDISGKPAFSATSINFPGLSSVIKTLFKSTVCTCRKYHSTGTLVVKPIFFKQLTPQIISSHKIIIHKLMVLSNYILSPTK